MMAYEVCCTAIAEQIAKKVADNLTAMGFSDFQITAETLHLWAKIKVSLKDRWQVWEVDTSIIGLEHSDFILFVGNLSLKIATWIGIEK